VVDSSGAATQASVTLKSPDSRGLSGFITLAAKTDADGSFVFRAIPPGTFMLQAQVVVGIPSESNLAAAQFGWLPVVVDGADQEELTIRVATGRSLKGRVVSDDSSGAPLNPREVSVTAHPVEFDFAPAGAGPPAFSIEDDGTFEVKNLSGHRLIRVSVRNPGWMLQRVTRLGSDITDEVIDFTKDDLDDVEVLVTNRVTSISGRVNDEKAKPVSACSVLIFAADRGKWGEHSRFIHLATASHDGSFSVRGLPPEDYFAIAIPATQVTPWQDPDFLRSLEQSATRLLLGDGEVKTLTLRLVR
jgi:hypothetical protein